MTETFDAIIIGGGAAGFFGAIACAQAAPPGSRVLVVERARRVLQKVKISGGGRCNVTHDCVDPKRMAAHYPRGNKALIGPLHRFGVAETIDWFAARGVALKTEADGRMFPVTDDSQTVIDCLEQAAADAGVEVRTSAGVTDLRWDASAEAASFELDVDGGEGLRARTVLLATGGTRISAGARLAAGLGHTLVPAVPSLFTFHVDDPRIEGLQGLAVDPVAVELVGRDRRELGQDGPLLVTHWGLSGPAVLKLSAWGARELHALDYRFELAVDWLPGVDPAADFHRLRGHWGARQVATRSPYDALPKRLWERLVAAAGLDPDGRWAELSKAAGGRLADQLKRTVFAVTGKSTHKDEFVTCGGVSLDEIDMRTMASRRVPGLHLAGELIDVDGVTGGFNFQNAWTGGYLAGQAMAGFGS